MSGDLGSPVPVYRRWAQLAVSVFKRTRELNGSYAANALTLVTFVSVFPLILLVVSITGLLTGSNPHLGHDLVQTFGLNGQAADTLHRTLHTARASGRTGSIIAVIGMAWSGLSLVGALRYVVNLPRGFTVKGVRARLMGVPWLLGTMVIALLSIGISAALRWLPNWTAPLAIVVALGVDVLLFGWTFWYLDTRRPEPRTLLPGVIFAAVGFEILKLVGTIVVPRLIRNSTATYGAIGVVFAIVAWLLVFGRLVVYAVVFNDVLGRADAQTTVGSDAQQDP